MKHRIGVIADDFTGATDIAGILAGCGLQTIQTAGVPDGDLAAEADAYVVSLKSRSCPAGEAINQSLAALAWLQGLNCSRFYFKVCSTFDSTPEGNIGPVTDALLDALEADHAVICPAFPENNRTIYKGYLFAGNELLSDSGMKDHPVTPMRDPCLSRLMDTQSRGKSGNIFIEHVWDGVEAVKTDIMKLRSEGIRYIIPDCLTDNDIDTIGSACSDEVLITGGSALIGGLVRAWSSEHGDTPTVHDSWRPSRGPSAIIAGSCSVMTNRQVDFYRQVAASRSVDPEAVIHNPSYEDELVTWLLDHADDAHAPMIYSTALPEVIECNREAYGEGLGARIELLFSAVARRLVNGGVKNLIIGGGETSGKVVQALGIQSFYIGQQIAPGVPWIRAVDRDVNLALKSGNFGDERFFLRCQELVY